MTPTEIIAAAAIIFLSCTAQSAVGFGFALFAVPPLLWIGMPLPSAIALVSTCSMLQAVLGAHHLREDVPWKLTFIAVAVRLVSLLGGIFLLTKLAGFDKQTIRTVIGGILCLLTFVQIIWRPKPMEHLHWTWGGLAFAASGLLAGVCGMGGPPLVLWVMAHNWSAQKTRGFLFAGFAISIPVQIIILRLTFGPDILRSVLLGIAFLPIVWAGAKIGLPLGNRMGKDRLRQIAYAILLILGISALVPALLQ
jgi:uncharacterized membrane protein YfcA